jgi:hypothetical protein
MSRHQHSREKDSVNDRLNAIKYSARYRRLIKENKAGDELCVIRMLSTQADTKLQEEMDSRRSLSIKETNVNEEQCYK